MAFVLLGDCVTMDEARGVVADGAVYVGDDGLLAGVGGAHEAPPPGFDEAPRVRTSGVIYPGLIDLHNHIAYNTLSLWTPPGTEPYRTDPYDTRYQWSGASGYKPDISDPAHVLGQAAGRELLKYVEVRAIVGGVTSIQGSPNTTGAYEGWLARNVEYERTEGKRTIFQCVFDPGHCDLAGYAEQMRSGGRFLFHLAEGRHESHAMHDEFDAIRKAGCLGPNFVGIHCAALADREFAAWRRAGAGSMVWSPLSNLSLYGETADVVSANDRGIRICLGSDWGPSGTKNLLGELKVADLWARDELHAEETFTREFLCRAVTSNPADAVGWTERLGRIKAGLGADLLVLASREADPCDNLVLATERDVRLVVTRGRPVYGMTALMTRCHAPDHEPIVVAGQRRAISLVDPDQPDMNQTWKAVIDRLEQVRADPAGALARKVASPDAFVVIPDMPWDQDVGMARLTPGDVVIPPLDSLAHDRAFFDSLAAAPILDGKLAKLSTYF